MTDSAAFRFPLDRVLDWRRRQAEIAEQDLAAMLAELRRIETATAAIEEARNQAQSAVRGAATLPAHELWRLSAYLDWAAREAAELDKRRAGQAQQVAAQRQRVLEARRKCELLDKLKESRRAEWRMETDRQREGFAAEAFLARWKRGR